MLRVLVYGAGSIGLYVAVRMKQAGHDVAIKARGAIAEHTGPPVLFLHHGRDIEHVADVDVLSALDDDRAFDLVVIATKAWQVEAAARDVAGVVAPDGRVVTIQNGVDAPELLCAEIAADHVIAGSIVVVASRTAPNEVELVGDDASLALGAPDDREPTAPDRRVLDVFDAAGMSAWWTDDIRSVLRRKLALVAAAGGVGALSGASIGDARAIPHTTELAVRAMREVIVVANAQGAHLTETDLGQVAETYRTGFPADTRTSLQRDLLAGRPSELVELHGAVVERGARAGVPTPINWTIFASQLPRETLARHGTLPFGVTHGVDPTTTHP